MNKLWYIESSLLLRPVTQHRTKIASITGKVWHMASTEPHRGDRTGNTHCMLLTVMTIKTAALESLELIPVKRVDQKWKRVLRQDLTLFVKVLDEAAESSQ